MNRSTKVLVLSLFFVSIFAFKAFSIGAGVHLGFTPGIDINQDGAEMQDFDVSLAGSIHFFRLPVVIAGGLEAGKENSAFQCGLSAFVDYWAIEKQIKNTWNFYSGCGFSGKLMTDFNDNWNYSLGPRFFAGMNWLFLDNYVEYYAQLAAVPSYVRSFKAEKGSFELNIPLETGVRLHF